MKASVLAKTLPALLAQKASVNLLGAPGGGKSSIFQQVAKGLGWDGVRTDIHPNPETQDYGYIEVTVPTKLIEDFGIPDMMTSAHSFGYKMPEWFPFEGHPTYPKKGFINFDDRGQANPDLQKIIANIQQARNLHGVPLMDGWSIVATGNRVKDRAGASRVLSHLADREIDIELETNLDDSCAWALANNIHPAIIAFWRFKPAMLHSFDPSRDKNATPRGWCDSKDGINAIIGNVPAEAELECFKGRIGEGIAIEFKAFMDMYRKLPNPDAVIMNPDTHAVPKEGSVLYALSGALSTRATEANFGRIMQFAERMPPEFTTLLIKDALVRNPLIASTPAFTAWAAGAGSNILL
jgi:hypothetical protein